MARHPAPQLSASLFSEDPAAAIDWLCDAFGFEVKIKVLGDDGAIHHSELVYGKALVMVSAASRDDLSAAPSQLAGRSTASTCLYVEDADAHCARARAAGATIRREPADSDYGLGAGSIAATRCSTAAGTAGGSRSASGRAAGGDE